MSFRNCSVWKPFFNFVLLLVAHSLIHTLLSRHRCCCRQTPSYVYNWGFSQTIIFNLLLQSLSRKFTVAAAVLVSSSPKNINTKGTREDNKSNTGVKLYSLRECHKTTHNALPPTLYPLHINNKPRATQLGTANPNNRVLLKGKTI